MPSGRQHLLCRGFDQLDVRTGPVGDVRNRVRPCIDPEKVAHDVCDGFGFDLDAFSCHSGLSDVGEVHHHVTEFVDLSLERLRWAEVVADGDRAIDEVGNAFGAVDPVEWSSLKGVTGRVDLFGDGFPDRSRRVIAIEQLRLRWQIRASDELTFVEDRNEL